MIGAVLVVLLVVAAAIAVALSVVIPAIRRHRAKRRMRFLVVQMERDFRALQFAIGTASMPPFERLYVWLEDNAPEMARMLDSLE